MAQELRCSRHFFLYAKGHYKTGDLLEDCKKILGEWCGVDPQYIRAEDVVGHLIQGVYPFIFNSNPDVGIMRFREFIKNASPDWNIFRLSPNPAPYVYWKAMLETSLSVLALVQVKEQGTLLLDLGEPDPKILPLVREKS